MVHEASITGLFRTLLILVGVFFLLKFLGRFMIAKREMEKEKARLQQERSFEKEKKNKLKNFGKVTISSKPGPKSNEDYVDFEEVD